MTLNFSFQFRVVSSPDEVIGVVLGLSTATSQTTQILIGCF